MREQGASFVRLAVLSVLEAVWHGSGALEQVRGKTGVFTCCIRQPAPPQSSGALSLPACCAAAGRHRARPGGPAYRSTVRDAVTLHEGRTRSPYTLLRWYRRVVRRSMHVVRRVTHCASPPERRSGGHKESGATCSEDKFVPFTLFTVTQRPPNNLTGKF